MDAFANAFESLRPGLTVAASRIVGPDDAQDVVMETYLKAWKALPNFNQRSSLKTWLYRIVRNCAIDYTRKRKRSKEVHIVATEDDDRTIDDLADPREEVPGDAIVSREEKDLVRNALKELDENHRTILLLRYTDEMSYGDMATILGISIGTVMSRLFNANRKLKRIVKQLEG